MKKLIPAVFPIVGYDDLKEPWINIGTAFFINKDGIFVTAAHTFKKDLNGQERTYYAIIDYKKVPITQIFREREDMENQIPPIHKDLYIGRLVLGCENLFFNLDTTDISEGTNLLTEGFARKNYVERAADDQPLMSIDDLYDDSSEEAYAASEDDLIVDNKGELLIPEIQTAELTEEERDLSRINYSKLNGKYNSAGLEKIFEFSPDGMFTNGFRFNYPLFDGEPKGYSGGPISVDGNLIGMLISKDGGISAAHIVERLKENNLSFILVSS